MHIKRFEIPEGNVSAIFLKGLLNIKIFDTTIHGVGNTNV